MHLSAAAAATTALALTIPLAYASACIDDACQWEVGVYLYNVTSLDSDGRCPQVTDSTSVYVFASEGANPSPTACNVLSSPGYCIGGLALRALECQVDYFSDGDCADKVGSLEFNQTEVGKLVDGIGSAIIHGCEAIQG